MNEARLLRSAAQALIAAAIIVACSPPHWAVGDIIDDWNNITIQVIRNDTSQPGPTFGSRNMAMVHAAMFDAINSISETHTPYRLDLPAPPGASREAAGIQAAYRVLVGLYPAQAAFLVAERNAKLAAIPNGTAKSDGIDIGETVALDMLAWRSTDGANTFVPYTPGVLPGMWRPDPVNPGQQALGPGWGLVTPFAVDDVVALRGPAPPALNSPAYTAAFNEVKMVGSVDAEMLGNRTPEQTEIGIFWGYDRGGLGPPPVLYNQITQQVVDQLAQPLSLEEHARLFALVNLAQADAGIACWDTKYLFNFWRPVTAIRAAATDGNMLTMADPNWVPLGAPDSTPFSPPGFTPPFPAYGSGHATIGAAFFQVLADYYGGDNFSFTLESDELPGVTRDFTSFSQAAEENGQSRIYLGIHWSFDKTAGIAMGNQIGDYVFQNYLQPTIVPEPSTMMLLAIGGMIGAGVYWRKQRRQNCRLGIRE